LFYVLEGKKREKIVNFNCNYVNYVISATPHSFLNLALIKRGNRVLVIILYGT